MKKVLILGTLAAFAIAVSAAPSLAGGLVKIDKNFYDDALHEIGKFSYNSFSVDVYNDAYLYLETTATANTGGSSVFIGADGDNVALTSATADVEKITGVDVGSTDIEYDAPTDDTTVEITENDSDDMATAVIVEDENDENIEIVNELVAEIIDDTLADAGNMDVLIGEDGTDVSVDAGEAKTKSTLQVFKAWGKVLRHQ